jgi:transposase
MLPEVRTARVLDAIVSHRAGRLSCVEAGELLGLSERHFRRLRDAYEDRGEEGLVDRRRGRVSSSRLPEAEAEWLAEMFRTRYFDFNIDTGGVAEYVAQEWTPRAVRRRR